MTAIATQPASASQDEPGELRFPAGFVWGAATAAYQIEGAANEDGRGPSIWDTFSRTPGKVYRGHTGDIACDHYHRYRDDVAIMADLGLASYRFSVAWPRIQPDGTGPVNHRGLDFYDRLVDELISHGIDPVVTLYHWDLPQTFEDRGGWTNRETAEAFADYALAVYGRLGDRVKTWTTLNEPWCSAYLGYSSGRHAPGVQDPAAAFAAVHHLNLAHGLGVAALRSAGAQTIGITLNPASVLPLDEASEADQAAVRLVDGLHNRIFLDPIVKGEYPADVLEHLERFGGTPWLRDGDTALINQPIDVLGVNFYSPTYVGVREGAPGNVEEYPGTEGIEFREPVGPVTDMGWQIEPSALTKLLTRIGRDYPGLPLLITENGAAYPDGPGPDERVTDTLRVNYLDGHLRACHDAISNGVDLRGYFVWSLLDNFEWAEGYKKRFGIVHVDYMSQRRTPKDSARWYREVIRRNGLAVAGGTEE
ncbi:GH1 family beta-glucosidase [Spirilliplanes yamanashiensis]|uniref:Beta-glucosidase n=1 Tax=Spirilliplanes yamanashiensis TaxID=42233 RepID=A0A8J3Y638_9ACTN|nr:GH1 family beta-glucosidase [Spirilliplanes yamanashiensis]MDP9814427.1 beta-glucosidase [Spirilliplanes yamanashiensis]GIJ02079.1 beta-glucosidase [Spirilliplanes yamanashiensis]